MANYFFLLDATLFGGVVRPALTASWQRRSFVPCRPMCEQLLPAARAYGERYHTGNEQPLLELALSGLDFNRHSWRALVSETLLFGAFEIPEFQFCAETLCCLLAPQQYRAGDSERTQFTPIQQAHFGTHDLTFGSAVYRPEFAGYNNAEDVRRLTDYLGLVRPEAWTIADLEALRDVDPEDRADELEFAREWFPALMEMYQRATAHSCVIVYESIF